MCIRTSCHARLPADPTGGGIDKWPCVQCQSLTAATVLMGAKPFREIDERSWDVSRRVADMDRDQVAAQALSPMPELLSYWLDASPATELARYVNGAIAEMVAKRPDRFYGLGCVPLQDPVRAAEELRLIKERFGLAGRRGRQQHQRSLSRRAPVRSVLRRGRGARTCRVRACLCTRCRRRIWRRHRA